MIVINRKGHLIILVTDNAEPHIIRKTETVPVYYLFILKQKCKTTKSHARYIIREIRIMVHAADCQLCRQLPYCSWEACATATTFASREMRETCCFRYCWGSDEHRTSADISSCMSLSCIISYTSPHHRMHSSQSQLVSTATTGLYISLVSTYCQVPNSAH